MRLKNDTYPVTAQISLTSGFCRLRQTGQTQFLLKSISALSWISAISFSLVSRLYLSLPVMLVTVKIWAQFLGSLLPLNITSVLLDGAPTTTSKRFVSSVSPDLQSKSSKFSAIFIFYDRYCSLKAIQLRQGRCSAHWVSRVFNRRTGYLSGFWSAIEFMNRARKFRHGFSNSARVFDRTK